MSYNVQQHNLPNLIIGTPEFSFSLGATSAADAATKGFRDFGNINSVAVQYKGTQVDHKGSYRGRRIIDARINTEMVGGYLLKADEMSVDNFEYLMFGTPTTDFTQTAVASAAAADALPTTMIANWWYDIIKSGVRVRNLLTVTCSSLVEGTDFFVDYRLGRIRFAADQSSSITPQYTSAAIVAGAMKVYNALSRAKTIGYGRLLVFDQNSNNELVLDHADFACEITINNQPVIDGNTVLEADLQITVTQPAGSIYVPKKT